MMDSEEVHERFNEILPIVKKFLPKEKYDEFEAKVNTDENNAHLRQKP